jgi:hypothetical protein
MAVSCRVDFDDERREEHVHAEALHTNEAAPMLALVSAEAVKRVAESRNMKTVSDQDSFPIDGNDGGAIAQDGGEGVVAHTDASCGDWSVRNESTLVGKHVIRGTSICND